jgi:predicted amidohydrolase
VRENKGYIKLFESRYGRFVVLICYEAEHAQIASTLLEPFQRGKGVDYIFNPSMHNAPERIKGILLHIVETVQAASVFVNNSPKGGSFIFNGTVSSFNKHNAHRYFMTVDLGRLRSLRPSGDERAVAPIRP